MRAFVIQRYGSIADVEMSDIEKPDMRDNEVLIKVKGAALNPADIKVITGKDGGKFLHSKKSPITLGYDFSGVIQATGDNVKSIMPGEEVFGFLPYSMSSKQGSFAEYVSAAAASIAIKPKSASFGDIASSATAASTALQGLRDKGRLKSGQKVLINGAAGGVGCYAVEIAKIYGAEVWGVCSEKSAEFVTGLGADKVIDYRKTGLGDIDQKFDIVFDVAATSTFDQASKILATAGTYITTLPSPDVFIGAIKSFFKKTGCKFVVVAPKAADLSEISQWVTDGRLKTPVGSTFEFSDLPAALAKMEAGGNLGKIAINIG